MISARVVKTLMGDGRPTTFYANGRRDGHYRPSCKGMVYAKNDLWRDGVVFRGDGIPRIPPQLEYCCKSQTQKLSAMKS